MSIPREHIHPHIPAVGQQINVNHDECPAGRDTRQRLYIKRTPEAVLAYCHNCNGHLVERTHNKVRPMALLEKLIREGEATELIQQEVKMPDDATSLPHEWPPEALAWVYQYNLDDTDILRHGISYSPSWGRVILPVYDGGKLIFWQGRRVNETPAPKYISVRSAHKPLFTVMALPHTPAIITRTVAIVEDYLSALRIAKSGAADAIALLGTDGPSDLPSRLSGYRKILVWLDADHAGRTKAGPLATRLSTTTRCKVGTITFKQPKECTDGEIYTAVVDTSYK